MSQCISILVAFKVLGRGTFGKVVLCREKKNQVLHIFKHIFCSCVKIQHLKNFIWMLLHCCLTDLVGFQKLYAMKILRKEVIVSRGEVKIENKQSNCLENNIFLLSRA